MEQGQDLGCAAADVFVRVLGRVVARLPGWARMRHGLKRPRLVLTPDREPKLRPQHVGLLDCLVPGFDGALFSSDWKDALWAKFFMGAPARRRRCVERSNRVKRA